MYNVNISNSDNNIIIELTDINEESKIYQYINYILNYKNEILIKEKIFELLKLKRIANINNKKYFDTLLNEISDIFFKCIDYKYIISFLDLIIKEPYIMDVSNNNIFNISDIITYYINKLNITDNSIINIKLFLNLFINYKTITTIGKGEFFILIMTDTKISDIDGKSDIMIDGFLIELKGNSGRLRGQYGFNSTGIAWNNFVKKLNETLPINIINELNLTELNTWNFNNKQLTNVISNYKKIIEYTDINTFNDIIKSFFKTLYTNIDDYDLNRFINMITIKDKIVLNENQLLNLYLTLNYNYYKKIEQFDFLMLFDTNDTYNILFIRDEIDFISKLGRNLFKVSSGISMKDTSIANAFGISLT